MKLKYVMCGEAFPIVFAEYLQHSQVKTDYPVTSAGFISIDFQKRKVTTYGNSTSLNKLGPQKGDDIILTRMFFPD